jgi:hypothetical protein
MTTSVTTFRAGILDADAVTIAAVDDVAVQPFWKSC